MKNLISKSFFAFLSFLISGAVYSLMIFGGLTTESTFAANSAEPTASEACSNVFPDVSCQTEIYAKAISFLNNRKIVEGYPDGSFRPNQVVNRAEMTKIIVEGLVTLGEVSREAVDQYADQQCFSDVPAGEWYTKYVCYGKAQNWLVGYSAGTTTDEEGNNVEIREFRPAQTVNFVEALKITLKGFDYQFVEGNIWYENSVRLASADNLIPFSITEFGENMERNEMSDLVARVLASKEAGLDEYLGDRLDLVVTYETIEAGINVSDLKQGVAGLN